MIILLIILSFILGILFAAFIVTLETMERNRQGKALHQLFKMLENKDAHLDTTSGDTGKDTKEIV